MNGKYDAVCAAVLTDSELEQLLAEKLPPSEWSKRGKSAKPTNVRTTAGSSVKIDVHKLSQERGIPVNMLIQEHKRLRSAGEID